jgi:DHA1 family bicyclomycin/chloramphenicol resistance-like MFS transporter
MPPWLPALLGFLTAVGPVSTDMYLPAFPEIERSFGTPPGTAQITLAAWFAGLSLGQIAQGSLSDRFGRRWPLFAGLALYTVASAGCALAPDLSSLSLMRALAAFGGSAGMVIPRAVIRDFADGNAAARLMSQLMLVMGVAPILAPTLGGLTLTVFTWHAIFWFGAGFGLISCVLVATVLPDTLPPERRIRLHLGSMLSRYGAIARDRSFLTHAGMGTMASFGMFAYLGGSPSVFIDIFHLSPVQYGMLFGGNAMCFILCTQLNSRLLGRFGSGAVLSGASRVYLAGAVVLTVDAWAGLGGLWGILLPITLSMSSMGCILPNAVVGAMSRQSAHAGSASALMGTLQYGIGAVSGFVVGLITDGTARPMAGLILLGALGAVLADRLRPPPGLRAPQRLRAQALRAPRR